MREKNLNFCTLFDSNYLSRGLAMYESLKKFHNNFNLYIYTFDEVAHKILSDLRLEKVILVSLQEFEDKDLLKIKNSRTTPEYCWTCTPSVILHSIKTFNLSHSIYIDADLYFYNSAIPLLKEIESSSILITEHRYTPLYDQTSASGIYCVQFMYFRNDTNGLTALTWWREKCIDWCYARFEDGKFGDQKYLDDWTVRFNGVKVLEHTGGGVAPWNIHQYKAPIRNLVFYHFHGFKYNLKGPKMLSAYPIPRSHIRQIYMPYIIHIKAIDAKLRKLFPICNKADEFKPPRVWDVIKQRLKSKYHYLWY